MTKNGVKELSFYLFFGLMIFAKGIGLDSGDKLYYVLSGIACVCMGCKLILTKYNKKQWAAMMLLGLIAFVAYRNSGRMGILLTTLTLVGMKDMDVKKLFRLGAVIYGVSFVGTVLMAKLGVIANPLVVHEKGGTEIIRWGMGYSTGNVFHISYFILVVFLCYTWGKNYTVKKLIGLMAGNFLVFFFSLSYTGVAVTVFYLLLNLYAVKRKRLSIGEKIICQLPLPFCLVFSFVTPFLLQYPIGQKINSILNGRPDFSAYYLQNQPITLFGTRMKEVPNFWIIMDNGYVYFFMTFGIVAFVLFCAGYAVLIARYSGIGRSRICHKDIRRETKPQAEQNGAGKELQETTLSRECLPELAMIFSFLLYGIMEQFISNAFMNVSLLFMGEVLFGGPQEEAVTVQQWRPFVEKIGEKTGKRWKSKENAATKHTRAVGVLVGGLTGAAVIVIYLAAVPMQEYIEVPIKSLNYVDAESVLVHIANEEGTKDYLKEQMQMFREQIQEEEVLEKAIQSAGAEDRLTAEELMKTMEFGVPVTYEPEDIDDTFRVRLLKLYYDIEAEEYRMLLEQMTEMALENIRLQNPENRIVAMDAAAPERIGKSFGTDRIEHMSTEQEYRVEKAGIIARIEYVRDGVFWAIAGVFMGWGVSGVVTMKKERERS